MCANYEGAPAHDPLQNDLDGGGNSLTNMGPVETDGLNIGSKVSQFAIDGYVVPVADGLGVLKSDIVDPAGTPTPVQDAADAVRAVNSGQGSGTILLPPEPVQEASTLGLPPFVDIRGWGRDRKTAFENASPNFGTGFAESLGSAIEFTATGTSAHGITTDPPNDGKTVDATLSGLTLRGPGRGQTTGSAINHPVSTQNLTLQNVRISEWGNSVWSGNTYECILRDLRVALCDPGTDSSTTPLFDFGGGPPVKLQDAWLYPIADQSGNRVVVFDVGNQVAKIENINIGGEPASLFRMLDNNGGVLRLHDVNFEPSASITPPQLGFMQGDIEVVDVKNITISGNTDFTTFMKFSGGADNANIEIDKPRNLATHSGSDFIAVNGDLTGGTRFTYNGSVANVTNNSGSTLSDPVVCMSAVTKKKSTGTGYDGGTNDVRL